MFTLVTTPAEITPEILDFCKSFCCEQAPFYIPIHRPAMTAGQCHVNVRSQIENNGGKQVFGWAIWAARTGAWLEADFHSLWQRTGGQLLDVTADPDGETRRLFVVDPIRTFQGFAEPKQYRVLSHNPQVAEAIRKLAAADKLRCKFAAGERIPTGIAFQLLTMQAEATRLLSKHNRPARAAIRSDATQKRIERQRQRHEKKQRTMKVSQALLESRPPKGN